LEFDLDYKPRTALVQLHLLTIGKVDMKDYSPSTSAEPGSKVGYILFDPNQ
jgi:hypothetical protein